MKLSTYPGYPVTPAVVFTDRPEWPAYEAPARWYVRPEAREVEVMV